MSCRIHIADLRGAQYGTLCGVEEMVGPIQTTTDADKATCDDCIDVNNERDREREFDRAGFADWD